MKMKTGLFFILFLSISVMSAQDEDHEVLGMKEFLAYVKEYHPVVKQADLHLKSGEAEVLRARGAFDPKLEIDYNEKVFKGTEYYEVLNSTFKIPTWYGVELKAGFEQNDGRYLNPENVVPDEGLFSAGLSMAVGQGLFLDERRATLRAAKAFQQQTSAERNLLVNDILYRAAINYLEWMEAHKKLEVYEDFLENSRQRFEGVSRSARSGEVAAIDTVEAEIVLQERTLQMEQARRELMEKRIKISGFLWLQNNIPVELQAQMIPDSTLEKDLDEILNIARPLNGNFLDEHYKMLSIEAKIDGLEMNRRLKLNKLLPKIDVHYNFLTPEADKLMIYNEQNYKVGVNVAFPLFLRKERGDVKLAGYKLQEAKIEMDLNRRELENKIETNLQEIDSYKVQLEIIEEITANYERMIAAEERKFSFGESSLFLVNTRENKLIEARLKEITTRSKYLEVKVELFRNLGGIPE